ncbi:hypothetical protein [Pseudorhodoplanes sp.]|uniref:hypothetical protein n=1 Tax=Pseudorhodoplanes sp. TaxID=1934341 RepID=UPI002D091D4E|nr:hypothetical protein [Pseudorhodoplanes sp.]HWV52656.1 hypothetical protein [Pseudorhodoplanes sp.]
MRKILLTLVAVASIAAATVVAPKNAEARCYGCWVGAGVAASVIAGAAIANAGYGYYGYPAYYGSYGGYGYGYGGYGGGYYQPAYYGYRPYYGYYAPRYYAPRYGYGYYGPRYYAPRYGYGYRPYRYGYRW